LYVRRQTKAAAFRTWSRIAGNRDWPFRSFDKTSRASGSAYEEIYRFG
jgi:hypothetical protein